MTRTPSSRCRLALFALLGASGLVWACDSSPELGADGGAGAGAGGGVVDGDGDGVADSLGRAVDEDEDGEIDEFDFFGDGSVVGPGVDTDGDGEPDAIGIDRDGDGIIDALDTDGDGEPDVFASTGGGGPGGVDVRGLEGGGGAGSQPPPRGNGEPEVCDGIDNDENGIIDDVDEGGDGICDCLNIGTVGRIGPWSSGGDIFKDWLDSRSPRPATELADQVLTEELLQGLDVVVVLRADTAALANDESPPHHEFDEDEVSVLESWVRSGGGLMTTIGYQSNESAEVVNVNRLLAPFDAGYSATNTGLNGFLEDWNEDHPISNGVTRVNTVNGVEPLDDSGTVVARDGGDRIGVVAHEPGDGHVIVFGDEWLTYDSEWEDTEDQQVELLWLNMIKWMSPAKKCQVAIPPRLIR